MFKRQQYDKDLARHPVLADCSSKELAMLSRHATPLHLPAGRKLMNRGHLGRDFLLLKSGSATVTIEGSKVAELAAGDFCGELALLDRDYPRRAEVVANTDMEVFVLDPLGFQQMMAEVPLAAERIREVVEKRRN